MCIYYKCYIYIYTYYKSYIYIHIQLHIISECWKSFGIWDLGRLHVFQMSSNSQVLCQFSAASLTAKVDVCSAPPRAHFKRAREAANLRVNGTMVWFQTKETAKFPAVLVWNVMRSCLAQIQDQKAHLHGTFVRMKDQGALALLVFHASWVAMYASQGFTEVCGGSSFAKCPFNPKGTCRCQSNHWKRAVPQRYQVATATSAMPKHEQACTGLNSRPSWSWAK